MPEDNEDILNTPIDPDDYKSEDPDIDIDIDNEEVDPIGDIELGNEFGDDELENELGDDEFDTELNDDSLDLPDDNVDQEFVAPEEQVKWTAIPQENGDIWSEHINGFVLRARPLSSQQGSKIKYSAQLFKDKKMVDDGVIWVDQSTDAREYLQNIADRILDRMNLVNLSAMEAEPEGEFGDTGDEELDLDIEGEEADLDIEGEEADLDIEGEEDLGL